MYTYKEFIKMKNISSNFIPHKFISYFDKEIIPPNNQIYSIDEIDRIKYIDLHKKNIYLDQALANDVIFL